MKLPGLSTTLIELTKSIESEVSIGTETVFRSDLDLWLGGIGTDAVTMEDDIKITLNDQSLTLGKLSDGKSPLVFSYETSSTEEPDVTSFSV